MKSILQTFSGQYAVWSNQKMFIVPLGYRWQLIIILKRTKIWPKNLYGQLAFFCFDSTQCRKSTRRPSVLSFDLVL